MSSAATGPPADRSAARSAPATHGSATTDTATALSAGGAEVASRGSSATVTRAEPLVARPPARDYPTPALLRLLVTLTVLAVVVFTTVATGQLLGARAALAETAGHVAQLNLLEDVRTELLRADAAAVLRLLEDPQDPARPDYRQSLDRARVLLIDAAEAQSADRDLLVAVNRDLDEYAALLERARAAQARPESQDALLAAGDQLRTVVTPVLDDLVAANAQRVFDGAGRFPLVVVITGALSLALLIGLTVVTMLRFRRVVNLGLAGALVLVGVSAAVAIGTLSFAQNQARSALAYDIATLRATAAARGHAYDARAQEALVVLTRPGTDTLERSWAAAADAAATAVGRVPERATEQELSEAWSDYEDSHARVREAVSTGQWDEARGLATGEESDSAGARFDVFDSLVSEAMTTSADNSRLRLLAPRPDLVVAATVTALTGLAAIGCAFAGIRPRLREYA